LVFLSSLASSAYAKGPFGSIHIGNWAGGAYTNDATGQFSHCAAAASYRSGIVFLVGANALGGWSLGFMHQAWQLSVGEVIPIDLTFDGRNQFHVFGTAQTPNFVMVPMPNSSSLLRDFRRSGTMAASAKGNVFQFNLNETAQLLPALANCVATVTKHGLSAAHDFTGRPTFDAATPQSMPQVDSTLKTQ